MKKPPREGGLSKLDEQINAARPKVNASVGVTGAAAHLDVGDGSAHALDHPHGFIHAAIGHIHGDIRCARIVIVVDACHRKADLTVAGGPTGSGRNFHGRCVLVDNRSGQLTGEMLAMRPPSRCTCC